MGNVEADVDEGGDFVALVGRGHGGGCGQNPLEGDDGIDKSVDNDGDGDDCVLTVEFAVDDDVVDAGGVGCGSCGCSGLCGRVPGERNHTEGDCVLRQLSQTHWRTPQTGPQGGRRQGYGESPGLSQSQS